MGDKMGSIIKCESTEKFIEVCAGLVRNGIIFKAYYNKSHYQWEIELTGGF
jgi:hypothetical protein